VYGLSNTTTENLQVARSVSTGGPDIKSSEVRADEHVTSKKKKRGIVRLYIVSSN
jgi:hypothetical protein